MRATSCVLGLALMLAVADAGASAQRTFVSTAGDDVNTVSNCSLVAPCRSFDSAITVTNGGGEIIVLDSGGYGPVLVDRAVTIEAPAGVYAGISVFAGNDGVTVSAPAAKVTLRGLSINGQGGNRGIVLLAADTLRVERCRITGMGAAGIEGTDATSRLLVTDSLIAENVSVGIYLTGGVRFIAERVRLERNDEGVLAFNVRSISIRDSTAVAHVQVGLDFVATGGNAVDVVLDRVVVTDNGYMGVNAFATGSGSNLALALTRSTVGHNEVTVATNGALRANSLLAGSTQMTIEDTVVQRNLGVGVQALNAGTRVTLSNSSVVGNGGFGMNNSSATLYTRGNNTIRGNNGMELTSQTTGTVTPLGGS